MEKKITVFNWAAVISSSFCLLFFVDWAIYALSRSYGENPFSWLFFLISNGLILFALVMQFTVITLTPHQIIVERMFHFRRKAYDLNQHEVTFGYIVPGYRMSNYPSDIKNKKDLSMRRINCGRKRCQKFKEFWQVNHQ